LPGRPFAYRKDQGGKGLTFSVGGWFDASELVEDEISALADGTARILDFEPATLEAALDKVLRYQSTPAWTDNTSEAKSAGGTPFTLLDAATDYHYFAHREKFNELQFDLQTLGDYGILAWEYSAGAGVWISLDDRWMLHLPFSEGSGATTADKSIYGKVANISGASWVAGRLSGTYALSFDGVDDYASITNAMCHQPLSDDWTILFWTKRTGAGGGDFPQIVGSRPWTAAQDKGWAIAWNPGGVIGVHFADGSSGFDCTDCSSSTNQVLDAVEHWAIVIDRANSKVKFYKNGAFEVERTPSFPAGSINQTQDVLLGRDLVAGARKWQGINYGTWVVRKALTATEVAAYYNDYAGIISEDGTKAFTQDGTLIFNPPSDWKLDTMNAIANKFWLRVKAGSVTTAASVNQILMNKVYNCIMLDPQFTDSAQEYDRTDYSLTFAQQENP